MPTKLSRGKRLGLRGLEKYMKGIVGAYVEKPGKVTVKAKDEPRRVYYTLSVHKDDLPKLKPRLKTVDSLKYIMNKATRANYGKAGDVNNQFSSTE